MYAAMADQVEVLQQLVSQGALITAQDTNGQTPMHFAALQVSLSNNGQVVWGALMTLSVYRAATAASNCC